MIGLLIGEMLLAGLIVSSEPNINNIYYIDTEVTKYNSIVTPIDSNLGSGIYKCETQKEYSPKDSSNPSSFTQKILYKYPKTISAPKEVYGTYIAADSGSSYTLSYSQTKSDTKTYSVQVSNSVSTSLNSSVKLETGIGVAKAEASASKSLGFETSITGTIEDSYNVTESYSETINSTVNESGLYRLETRSLFDVYIVEYVTGVYDIKRVGNKYVYTDKIAYYTIETSYILSYIEGSDCFGLFEYYKNDDTGKYQLDQDYAKKIYGSSNINFID